MSEKQQANISVLDYPENVRLRRGMYLLNPDHTVFEIVDNATDEYAAGHADRIDVSIIDDEVIVIDNGAGIPVTPHKDPRYKGLSQAEVAYVTLHAGGKFNISGGYRTNTGGLNGVGASCVNAVSSKVNLIIRTDGKEYEIDFAKGKTTKHLYVKNEKVPKKKTGTEVHYVLDKEVWGEEWFDFTHIRNRLQELAYLNPGLTISFKVKSHTVDGSPVEMESEFHYPDGIKEFIDDSVKGKEVLAEPLIINDKTKYTVKIHPSKEIDGKVVTDYEKSVEEKRTMDIDIAIVYTGAFSSTLLSFVNNVRTEYGGDHETGFKMGVFGALKKYLAEKNLIKNDTDVESDDCREGMTAIVSIKLKDPNYEGQGKGKIRMNIVRQAVKKSVEKALSQYLEENDERAQKITEKVLQAIRAREAARKARAVSRGLKNIEKVKNVENLADCSCKDPEKSEIFLVEGRLELPSLNPLNCGEVLDRGESAAKNVQKMRNGENHFYWKESKQEYVCWLNGKQKAFTVKRFGCKLFAWYCAYITIMVGRLCPNVPLDNEDGTVSFMTYGRNGYHFVTLDEKDAEQYFEAKKSIRKDNTSKTFYAYINSIPAHILLMGTKEGYCVDHINRNGLDNTRKNLRLIPRSINNRNINLRKDNSSGLTGIHEKNNSLVFRYYDNNGIRHSKSWSMLKYGKEKAMQYVTDFRNSIARKYGYLY